MNSSDSTPQELGEAKFMAVRIKLRLYYNEIVEILEAEDEGDMTTEQSEKALMQLDDKYAKIITGLL